MAWITADDLVAAFGQREIIELTDRDEPRTGSINDAVAARAITEAEDLVSGLLRRRYPDWPTPTIPSGVKTRTADIARRRLYGASVPEVVQANYEDAIDWLKVAVFSDDEMGVEAGVAAQSAIAGSGRAVVYDSYFDSTYLSIGEF